MKWNDRGVSGDIEDRRGEGGGGGGFRFGGGGFGGRGLGIGGVIVLFVLGLIFKQDFLSMGVGGGDGGQPAASAPDPSRKAGEEKQVRFVSFVLDDLQATWTRLLPEAGTPYRRAKLVLFWDAVDSACGAAQASSGPFYCPGDEKVHIDLGFFDQLSRQFGAPGEFAQAYVLAHEIGHHVQRLMGVEGKVRSMQRSNPQAAKALSVRLELQADCLAGVWGNSAAQRDLIDTKDVEAGLRAAAAIGDDRIQRMSGRAVSPESFTHGSSEQRVTWFKRGLESGSARDCDTLSQ